MEIDYARRLSPQEQEWLASFNEAEYGSNPDCLEHITGLPVSQSEKQRMWREIKRYQRDALSSGPRIDLEACVSFIDLNQPANEDGWIEMIDSQTEIELITVQNLKIIILSRDWSIHGASA